MGGRVHPPATRDCAENLEAEALATPSSPQKRSRGLQERLPCREWRPARGKGGGLYCKQELLGLKSGDRCRDQAQGAGDT